MLGQSPIGAAAIGGWWAPYFELVASDAKWCRRIPALTANAPMNARSGEYTLHAKEIL